MPPRHAYWTILVDDKATAFRAHEADELLPTLNRLKDKHPSAVMKWFERGKLWDSRDEAREAGLGKGERRYHDHPARADERGDGEGGPDARARAGRESDDRPRDRNWRPGGE